MKKTVALLFALVMAFSVCACSQPAPAEETTEETAETAAPAEETPAEKPHFDKLTLEFVPSKDADVIITGTKNLPELVKAEMSNLGYDIDEVDITVGTSYDATGEAMSAGSIDLGWLPGGTYALYSDDTDVILTATRNGLSNDSTDPKTWNGEANATQKNGPQVTYYRSLIYATPSEYGKKLAEKVNNGEALTQLTKASTQRVDLIKLMITGGVLDATEKGTPGELKMPPEMVKAVCDQAHAMGYPVAAHTESPEGVKVALENGVDSIEHGAKMDEETVKLYKEHGAFLCTTISPALPYALFDTAVSGASEKDQYNGRIVFDGIVESAKTALANGIPVGLGNDVGCPYITQYDFWRELCYFHKYCGVSNQFALHTATLRNARLAGVGDVTGSLEVGKDADIAIFEGNPLRDIQCKTKAVFVNGQQVSKG